VVSSNVNIRIGDEDAVIVKVGRQVYTLRDGEMTEDPFEALTPLQRRMLEMRLRHWADKAREPAPTFETNPVAWPGIDLPEVRVRRGGIQYGQTATNGTGHSTLLASGGWCAPSETLYATETPLSLDDLYQDAEPSGEPVFREVWGAQTGSAQHPASHCGFAADPSKDDPYYDEDDE
jgi:hypothetical protein